MDLPLEKVNQNTCTFSKNIYNGMTNVNFDPFFLCDFQIFAGYSLLARRSAWCNGLTTSLNCGTLYARLGEGSGGGKMVWRCYCASALVPSKYSYSFNVGARSSAYVVKHDELLAIN